ncbi:response regulator transcription factor [Piscinibacter sp.]|uniref:response regulator transcription factor n=1 Tax=Piscinibacter sp. TaxID=1903157 RepID=UPI00355A6E16
MSAVIGKAPVYLVDDDTGVREAVSFLLASRGLEVRAHASGPSLLDALCRAPRPVRGVFLLDIRMEPMSGLRLHEELMALQLRNPVLFLTGHGDVPMAVEALKKGAFDFLEKPYGDNALADRIEQALAVEATLHAQGARAAERDARLASLTDREREVMLRVAAGKLNKVIADELRVSMRTVEVHRARVYAKLGVRSSAEVATLLAT